MKNLNLLFFALLFISCNTLDKIDLDSPDGKIKLTFGVNELSEIYYSVDLNDNSLIQKSRMGFLFRDETNFGNNVKIFSHSKSSVNNSWQPVYGERAEIHDNYNEVRIQLEETGNDKKRYEITFRAYNEGIAFNYTFLTGTEKSSRVIIKELTEFNLNEDFNCWVSDRAQSEYRKVPISSVDNPVERPLVIETGDKYIAIGEARLVNFSRMKLIGGENKNSLVSSLHGETLISPPFTTPWRTIMIGETPGELLENNFFFENLCDPCAIDDVSWIKPGKVIREVTLTTQGGKACVDFAAANGLDYVEFDAGWYGPENSTDSDASTVTVDPKRSPGPLDLQAVIKYAKSKDIGVLVYVNRRALEQQLDEILPLYRKWGIKGVKYGFVQVGPQEWTTWLHEAVKKAAENQLMVDIHDEYRPTGFSRTYPNLMTQEGIRGDEESPSNEHTLITLFTRMLAGAGDNTNCYYAPRVTEKMGGHVSQLAKAVMLYSPWQFLYWYDRPQGSPGKKGGAGSSEGYIQNHPELDFFKYMPVTWDESRVLNGAIGKYATIVRKSGDDWYLGSLTAKQEKTINLKLDFLDDGSRYEATVYSNDPTIESSTKVRIDKKMVNSQSELNFDIGANSGLAIRFHKL